MTRGEGNPNEDYFGQEISQGTGQLDADGVLHVTLPTEVDAQKRDYRYRIEAHVTDASNREIVGGHGVTVTYSTIVVLLETDRYVYAPGQQADVTVHTLDYDSNPVSTSVQLSFESHRSWGERTPRNFFPQAGVSTDAHGVAHYTYTVPKVPWLTVYATSTDSNQREATFSTSLWISDVSAVAEEGVIRSVDIYPDKHSYKPGDTAHVLISTHTPGAQVLVTTEGQQVYTWSLHPTPGDSLMVDIPIEERFEPNFFLNVAFVKNEQLIEGSKNISVPAVEKVLKVTGETDKPEYRPGEKVTYTVTAQDAQGHPVSAELSWAWWMKPSMRSARITSSLPKRCSTLADGTESLRSSPPPTGLWVIRGGTRWSSRNCARPRGSPISRIRKWFSPKCVSFSPTPSSGCPRS